MNVEEWWSENFNEVKYRSMVKIADGIYVVWLERDEDKRRILEEKGEREREGWRRNNGMQGEERGRRKQKMDRRMCS